MHRAANFATSTTENCPHRISDSPHPIDCARFLLSCQSRSIAREFSLPVAALRKIADRSRKSVSRFGQTPKSLRAAIATRGSQRPSITGMASSSTLEADHQSPDAGAIESRELEAGGTFWATRAAVIFFPFRRFV